MSVIEATINNTLITAEIVDSEFQVTISNTLITAEVGSSTTTYVYSSLARIETDISYLDFATGYKSIGNIPADRRVHKVSAIVTSAFDAGTMVIGEASAHGRLMAAGDNNLLVENTYQNEPDYKYTVETEIKVWFETGSPTQGTATIIVYYN